MAETLPYLTRMMRLRLRVRLDQGRLLIFMVLCLTGLGVEFTNTATGVASQYQRLGNPNLVADAVAFTFVIAGLTCIYVRHWWGDLVTLFPLVLYLGLAIVYTLNSHNLSGTIVYFNTLALVSYVLWRD